MHHDPAGLFVLLPCLPDERGGSKGYIVIVQDAQRGTDVLLCDVLSGAQNVLLDERRQLESKKSVLGQWLQSALSLPAVFVVGCVVNRATGCACPCCRRPCRSFFLLSATPASS